MLDSNILNYLKNTYKFTATQTNENDLLGGLLALLGAYIGLILVIGLIAIGMVYVLGKTALEVIKIPWFWVVLGILTLAGIGVAIYFAVRPPTTTTNPNPSGQPPSPPPLDPSKPGPSEIECVVNNMAGCKCSIFLQKVEGKTTDELCAPFQKLNTTSTSSIEEQCKSLNIQWGNPPSTFEMDYCIITQGRACSSRTYSSQSGIRAYCTSSTAEPTSSAPTK